MYDRIRLVQVDEYWKYHVYAKRRYWPFWRCVQKTDYLHTAEAMCKRMSSYALHKGKPILEEYVRVGSQYAKDACIE